MMITRDFTALDFVKRMLEKLQVTKDDAIQNYREFEQFAAFFEGKKSQNQIYEITNKTTSTSSGNTNPNKEKDMPPRYADGTLRTKGSTTEYRFMFQGKQKSVTGRNEQDCYDKRTALIASSNIKSTKNENEKSQVKYTYFKQWINEWLTTFKQIDLSDPKNESTSYQIKHILDYFADKKLKEINTIMLQQYLNTLTTTPNKKYKITFLLKECFRTARQTNILKYDPAEIIKIPRYEKQSYKVLTYEQQELLLTRLNERKYYLMYRILCCTGMRIGEFLALSYDNDDVNYQDMRIYVNKSKRKEDGQIKSPKTRSSKRYIPFTEELTPLLNEYEQYAGTITYNAVRIYFKRIYKSLNMDTGYTVHSLRHTFASVCYDVGIKEKQIQAWLGHSKLDMTLNVYTELLKSGSSFVKDYIKKLANNILY